MSGPTATELGLAGWPSVHFAAVGPDVALDSGLRVALIDGAAIESKQDLMAELARALELPDHFGSNWDALTDVLRDLGWLEAKGHVLIIGGAEALWRNRPELAGTLVSVWIAATEWWGEREVPFHLVFVR